MKINKIIFTLIILLTVSQNLFATSLDGTTNIVYKENHYIFEQSKANSAEGFVWLEGGFTIPEHTQLTLKINPPVSSGIDLRTTGTLTLESNLKLESNLSFSSSGFIKGNNNAIILNDDLTIPAAKNLEIIGNTIINGNGHNLILDNWAQILVDGGVTLTLKNITIKNVVNSIANPPIKLIDQYSQLALDEVTFVLNDDFAFPNGQLFIHNDVIFTGSSKFSYRSVLPSYITPHACLYFDIDTTFEYYPSSTRDDLIVLYDETSSVFLNGCTLQTTHTGIKLTKGRLFFDNKVTLSSAAKTVLDSLTLIDSKVIGEYVNSIGWSPDQHYISIGTQNPNSGQELQLYSFYNDTLTSYTSKQYGVDSPYLLTTKFSPNGKYLSIGGHTNNPRGDEEFQIYSFYNDTLSTNTIQSKDTAWWVAETAWSPDGENISIANYWPITAHNDIELYGFQNEILTTYTNRNFGDRVNTVDWRPNEKHIAFGSKNPTDTAELHIYSFINNTMSDAPVFKKDYGPGGSFIHGAEWNPDGQYLALGGYRPHSGLELQIYSLINDTLSTYTSKNYGTRIQSVSWSPDGQHLAIGGRNAGDELQIYSFKDNQLSASPIISQSWGYEIYSISWSPDGNYLAVGGQTPDSGKEFEIYKVNYRFDTTTPTLSNAIRFGNSSKGSSYNLNTYVLGGATIEIDGLVWSDDA